MLERAEALGLRPTEPPDRRQLGRESENVLAFGLSEAGVELRLVVEDSGTYGGKRWASFSATTPCVASQRPPPELNGAVRDIGTYIIGGRER